MFGPRATLFAMYSNFFFVLGKRNTINSASNKQIEREKDNLKNEIFRESSLIPYPPPPLDLPL